jgi:hypothetical protein
MSLFKKMTTALLLFALTGCGGGGGGSTSTGGVHYTHSELAAEFVRRMNIDLGYDLELVKTNTYQYDYVVVYDWDLGSYDAYYLGTYNPGESLWNYLDSNDWRFYYDLIALGGNEYEDVLTGTIFEKVTPSNKDRLKMAALEETLMIKKGSETLQADFGLSQERAFEVAKLAVAWQKTPKERMSDVDHDRFATDVLGHSITEYQRAVQQKQSGDSAELKRLVADTAVVNGVTPEQANQIIGNVFGLEL